MAFGERSLEEKIRRAPWTSIVPEADVSPDAVARFSCGHEDMDGWFHDKAHAWASIGRCGVHVGILHGEVVGFYTLSPVVATAREYPKKARSGKTETDLAAWLIGRLGVSVEHGGDGVGTSLLWHAIKMACNLSNMVGGVAVAIEPKNEGLAEWYKREGFSSPTGNWQRLYLPIKVARKSLKGIGDDRFSF